MERLSIKNFLCIKEADFEVGRFNIIIGSQASGKSVISKVLYFFKEIFYKAKLLSVSEYNVETTLYKNFKKYFPEYTWKDQNFQIDYEINNIGISLINTHEGTIEVVLSDEFVRMTEALEKLNNVEDSLDSILELTKLKKEFSCLYPVLFIPATRSFFAIMQKNIFYLLDNDIKIDPFLKKFGSLYENAKRSFIEHDGIVSKSELQQKTKSIIHSILKGNYFRKDEQDWIEMQTGEIVNLFHSSSGQQESLPMLIILSVWVSFIDIIDERSNAKIFIEEPEAHLFPVSQKHIISLLGVIYNHSYDFVLTTHSPYILTAINNAILAQDVIEEKGKEAVKAIFDPDFSIKYEDVNAYTIEDGRLISIMDDEARFIGATIIDSVSDDFETDFDNLLDLQAE
ncbi:MAG: AAA family ATPase [Methylococcales bacterium]|nr:AAA family ATPase [Methylococcales bacterium]